MKADLLITQDIVFARDARCPTLFYEHYLIRWHIYSFQVAARDQDDASVRFLAIGFSCNCHGSERKLAMVVLQRL